VICKHTSVGLMRSKVTRVPNRMRGRMFTVECLKCGLRPITWPLGHSRSNDRHTAANRELRLARHIAALYDWNDSSPLVDMAIDRTAQHHASKARIR
jgi:hypothetical protein